MSNHIAKYLNLLARAAIGKGARKREARYQFVATLAKRWNFRAYQWDVSWYTDSEILEVLSDFPSLGGVTAKRYNLYYLARSVAHLDGDTVECGVATGISSYLICCATSRPGRSHHAFDSFAGLPEAENIDVPPNTTFALKKGDFAVSENEFKKNLATFDSVQSYKGWIPNRFNEVDNRQFIFIHIDVDFYQATLDSIQFFYPKIVPGGMIVCDDYGFVGTPGARFAVDEFLSDKPESVIKLDAGHALIIKQ